VSGALAIALLVCMLGAVLSVMLVGRVVDASGVLGVLLGLGRWVVAVLLLAVALTLLLRFCPTQPRPIRWVSAGSVVITAFWIGASLAFGWYATSVASYGSLFGSLASVFILLAYVYVSSLAFVLGVQLDKVLEVEVRGRGSSGKRRA
jgi:membrane protein